MRSEARVNGRAVDRPRRLLHLEERPAGRDLVVYDPRRGRMHVLNVTAAFVWRQCDGARSQDDIIRSLRSEFDLEDQEQAAADVRKILGLFREEALIDGLTACGSESIADRQQSGGEPPPYGGEGR